MTLKRDFIFDPSLVLYLPLYKLDGASFMSKDAYGHLATATGALWRPNGRELDGDDYVQIGDVSTFKWLHGAEDISGFQLTLELWMKLLTPEPDDVYTLFSTGGRTSSQIGLDFVFDDRSEYSFSRHFFLYITTGVPGEQVISFQTINDIYPNDSDYHHIVLTYNQSLANTNTVIYVDVVQKDTGNKTAFPPVTSNPSNALHIGSVSAGDSAFLTGSIGEVRIYNRALTPLEIQHNYLVTKWRYR